MSRRCVFFDRDGVINVNARPHEYVRTWDEFHFIPAAADWMRLCKALDFLVIIVTNQRGVARGLMTEAQLTDLHARMLQLLVQHGAAVDDIFVCPHEEGTCDCRKPRPGMIYAAQRKWDIDLSGSLLIGDSEADQELAARCGLRFLPAASGRFIDSLPAVPNPLAS